MSEAQGTVVWRLSQLERRFEALEHEMDAKLEALARKVDRLTLMIAGGAVTFAVSVAVFAFTVLATGTT
jgi:hypothetical protein